MEYEEYEDCLHAIDNMDESELCGKVIHVSFANAKKLRDNYYNNTKPIWNEENYIQSHSEIDIEHNDDNAHKKIFN